MSFASIGLNDALQQYLLDVSLHEPEACRMLRLRTLEMSESAMISSPEQVQLIMILAKLLNAKQGLEIGVFTGYTSLRLALGLPELRMVCCDVSETFTAIARKHWGAAGVQDRIDLNLAPAQQTLTELINEGQASTFDFAYIDADKTGYRGYVESCQTLVRPGGLILLDNVLWSGSVADPNDDSEDTVALRELNTWLHETAPGQFDLSLIPIGDGLTLIRKF